MGAVPAQELDLEDFEARADYGYFTEDATGLRNLIRDARASLEKGGDVEGAHYALAFAQYRLGQVLAPKDQAAAAVAMASCIDEFGKTPESGASAEDNVLQAACHGQLAQLRTLTALLNSRLSVTRLEKARKLDARNPRLALIDAQEALRRGDKASALIRLKTATTLFEAAESARFAHAWGQADAWALLGSGLLEKGDTLAARSAIERALLIAPEYAMARRLLTRVSAPAR
jgi:tetratricopeptide (TPR) repeat protein